MLNMVQCPLVKNANIGIGLKSNSIKTFVFTFISMKFTRNIVYSKGGSHFFIANAIRSVYATLTNLTPDIVDSPKHL